LLCFLTVLVSGCAKEQSQEQRLREETERKYARLSKAAGVYLGYLERRTENLVPVELTVTVQNNPIDGQDEPLLQGSLRIGLLGGVKIASSASSFDWGNGRLSFKFERKSGDNGHAGAIEVRALFTDGVLKNAVLDAPRQGSFPLTIARGATSLFSAQSDMNYGWKTPGAEKIAGFDDDAVLSLSLRNESFAAPANLDLPYLPGLDGTVRFSALAKSPEVAREVIYDPLDGTLELYFTESSRLRFDGLFLRTPESVLVPEELRGFAALSSVQVASVAAKRLSPGEPLKITALPPRGFRGIYKGQGIPYRSEVYFDYLGTQGNNSLEFPFPYFPRMRLEHVICVNKVADTRQMLNLVSIDHLNGIAAFQFFGSTNHKDLELHYTPGWQSLDGYFMAGQGVGTARPRLTIAPYDNAGEECADPK